MRPQILKNIRTEAPTDLSAALSKRTFTIIVQGKGWIWAGISNSTSNARSLGWARSESGSASDCPKPKVRNQSNLWLLARCLKARLSPICDQDLSIDIGQKPSIAAVQEQTKHDSY